MELNDILTNLTSSSHWLWDWCKENIPPELVGALMTAGFVALFVDYREKQKRRKYFDTKVLFLCNQLDYAKLLFNSAEKYKNPNKLHLEPDDIINLMDLRKDFESLGNQVRLWMDQMTGLVDSEVLDAFSISENLLQELMKDFIKPSIVFIEHRLKVHDTRMIIDWFREAMNFSRTQKEEMKLQFNLYGEYGDMRLRYGALGLAGEPEEHFEKIIQHLLNLTYNKQQLYREKDLIEKSYENAISDPETNAKDRRRLKKKLKEYKKNKKSTQDREEVSSNGDSDTDKDDNQFYY